MGHWSQFYTLEKDSLTVVWSNLAPYAIYTENGIALIYNASNAANFNGPALPKFTYAAGQALFDKTEPYKLIERTDSYFIYPDKDYEKVGEVNEVCFVEGLVFFKEK